jgi:transposase
MSNRGYSVDLRERVVKACDDGMSEDDAAALFGVGSATVYRWKALRRETGALDPRSHGGGNPAALDESKRRLLAKVVREKPDRTLHELTVEIMKRANKIAKRAREAFSVSASSVGRALDRLGLTRKKKASRRSRRIAQTSRNGTRSSSKKSPR